LLNLSFKDFSPFLLFKNFKKNKNNRYFILSL